MTTVTITAENPGSPDTRFRASTRDCESTGPTAGTALDALTGQLGDSAGGTLVVVQNLRPDEFFTAAQQNRLQYLLEKWRAARDSIGAITPEEQAELETLVDTELDGSTRRAAAMARELRS